MLILIKLSFLFEIALPEYLLLHQSVVVLNVKLQSNNFLHWFFCDDNTADRWRHRKNVEIMLFKSVLLSQSAALRSRTFLVHLRILLIWSWKLESYQNTIQSNESYWEIERALLISYNFRLQPLRRLSAWIVNLHLQSFVHIQFCLTSNKFSEFTSRHHLFTLWHMVLNKINAFRLFSLLARMRHFDFCFHCTSGSFGDIFIWLKRSLF